MLHFRMNMPFFLMAFYGTIMIVIVLLLRAMLKNRLPKFVFPVLWGVVLLRLLVTFSLSSPLSLPVPGFLSAVPGLFLEQFSGETALIEDTMQLQPGTAGNASSSPAVEGSKDFVNTTQIITEEVVTGYGTEISYAVSHYDAFIPQHGLISLLRFLPALYLLGLAATAGILARQKYIYGKKLKSGLLMEHNETVNELLRSMGMGHVLVFSNDEIASPLVCGLINPRIYLPTRMDFGNTVLLRHVLAHETMHIRHRDNLLKLIMLAALVLNWYNPLVWLMAKCLASDLEAACDAAVLGRYDEEERKGYAFSLLAMAITGGRTTLLYSAFSRTEVERRVKGVLAFKKATAFVLLVSMLFVAGSSVVFATGGQAPFSSYLTSYCASSSSKWGVRAEITRDIALGEQPQKRAEEAVFDVLRTDETGDPDIIREAVKTALAAEFGVERSAFDVKVNLCLDSETVDREYADWGITRLEDNTLSYQGEQVRTYRDEMLGHYQSRGEGAVDIVVQRNRLGEITAVTAWHEGDAEYDRRTGELSLSSHYYSTEISQEYMETFY